MHLSIIIVDVRTHITSAKIAMYCEKGYCQCTPGVMYIPVAVLMEVVVFHWMFRILPVPTCIWCYAVKVTNCRFFLWREGRGQGERGGRVGGREGGRKEGWCTVCFRKSQVQL